MRKWRSRKIAQLEIKREVIPISHLAMTVMQLLIQPFGIMNALRVKFLVPISATGALAAAVAAPKSTALYKFCGASLTSEKSNRY